MKKFLIINLLLLISFPPMLQNIGAQEDQNTVVTPYAVAVTYFLAIKQGDAYGIATHLHPEALKEFRNIFEPFANIRGHIRFKKKFLGYFDEVATIKQLKELDDLTFFVKLFKTSLKEKLAQSTKDIEYLPQGSTFTMTDSTYMLFHKVLKEDRAEFVDSDVVSFQETQKGWKVFIVRDLRNVIKEFETLVTEESRQED